MSHLGIRDDGLGHPPWCRGNATAVPATSKTAIAAGTVVLNRPPITRGTDSSNPSPSSRESGANQTNEPLASPPRAASVSLHRPVMCEPDASHPGRSGSPRKKQLEEIPRSNEHIES